MSFGEEAVLVVDLEAVVVRQQQVERVMGRRHLLCGLAA